MKHYSILRKSGGRHSFTLAEIMAGVLLIGVVLGIGIPSYRSFTEQSRIEGAMNELVMDIQFARSLAVSKNRSFQFQFADNGYRIIDMDSGAAIRNRSMPSRVDLAASGNPRFRSYGRFDPVNITVSGSRYSRTISVVPAGNVRFI
jgi:Tfp pilus assembly protein PilE